MACFISIPGIERGDSKEEETTYSKKSSLPREGRSVEEDEAKEKFVNR